MNLHLKRECNIGEYGATGSVGATGDVGATGPKGSRGATGSQGEQGRPGFNGLVGATGTMGFDINFIDPVVATNLQSNGITDSSLTIDLNTTGETTNFFMTKGSNSGILNLVLPSRHDNSDIFNTFLGKRIRIDHGYNSIHFQTIQPCFFQIASTANNSTSGWVSITDVTCYNSNNINKNSPENQQFMSSSTGCIELVAVNQDVGIALGIFTNNMNNSVSEDDKKFISWIATYV